MTEEIGETLHAIDTRLSLVESEVHSMTTTKRWIQGLAVVVLIQIGSGIAAFTRLSEQVSTLDLEGMKTNTATALRVLQDHGSELEAVRTEQARIRGVQDRLDIELNQRTSDRFTGRDGDRLDRRVQRLEDIMLNHEHDRRISE